MKKGFATSAIMVSMLLMFLVLMIDILNNLQNKKTVLDSLKTDTISALDKNTVVDAVLDQLGIVTTSLDALEKRVTSLEDNTYNKEEIDNMFHVQTLQRGILIPSNGTQEMLDAHLNTIENYTDNACTKELIYIDRNNLTLSGGNWIVETCKTNNLYAYQIVRSYSADSSGILTYERSLLKGVWNSWKNPYN